MNGDIIFDIDINRFFHAHKNNGGLVTLFTHPNSHPYDSVITMVDENCCLTNWLHKEDERLWYKNRVNAGMHLISTRIFGAEIGVFNKFRKLDLDRDVLKPLISSKSIYAYDSPEYVKDMGTPDRFYSIIEDIKLNRVYSKNLVYF